MNFRLVEIWGAKKPDVLFRPKRKRTLIPSRTSQSACPPLAQRRRAEEIQADLQTLEGPLGRGDGCGAVPRECDGNLSPGASEMLATKMCQGVPRAFRCHTSRLSLSW
jgi:hypothetical protein